MAIFAIKRSSWLKIDLFGPIVITPTSTILTKKIQNPMKNHDFLSLKSIFFPENFQQENFGGPIFHPKNITRGDPYVLTEISEK